MVIRKQAENDVIFRCGDPDSRMGARGENRFAAVDACGICGILTVGFGGENHGV